MKKVLLFLAYFLSFSSATFASSEVTIQDIANYLNSIRNFKADFLQEDNFGNQGKGVIYIKKPLRFRLETFEPSHTVIVGNKSLVVYHDYELNETSHTTVDNGAIYLLITDHINFNNKQIEIKSFKNNNSTIEIESLDNSRPDIGTMTMVFSKSPIELRQIRAKQSNSKVTMNLYNREINVDISQEKFIFEYPKVKNPYSNQR